MHGKINLKLNHDYLQQYELIFLFYCFNLQIFRLLVHALRKVAGSLTVCLPMKLAQVWYKEQFLYFL
jgi:hypothetical protein